MKTKLLSTITAIVLMCGVTLPTWGGSITFTGATTVGSYCRRPITVRANTDNLPIRAGTLRVLQNGSDFIINSGAYSWYSGFDNIVYLGNYSATVAPYIGLNTIGWNFTNQGVVNPLQTTNAVLTNYRYRSTKGTGTVTHEGYVINNTGSSIDASLFGYQPNFSDPIVNILTGQTTLTVNLEQVPCITDTTAPTINNFDPIASSFAVAQGSYPTSFTIFDRLGAQSDSDGNSTIHYRFNPSVSPANYVPAPNSVDNQVGMNSGSIQVRVQGSTNLLAAPFNYVLSGASLTKTNRAGNGSINSLTRDRKTRGYDVSFIPLTGYGIEQLITVSVTGTDLSGNAATSSFSFNAPENPIINIINPAGPNGSAARTDRSPRTGNTLFQFQVLDTRAGVNTGSISLGLTSSSGVFTPLTLSSSDLSFSLISGSVGAGNSGGYLVTGYSSQAFPVGSTMFGTITGTDLAGNTISTTFQFSIRQSCDYYGCSEILGIEFEWNPSLNFEYIYHDLYITGTDLPYVSLSGNVLNCGLQTDVYTGVLLTGNVSGATLYPYVGRYTGENLIITGGTIDIDTGNKIINVVPY